MRDMLLQRWTTLRCLASAGGGVTSLTQDAENYLEMTGYTDAAFVIDVADLTLPSSATVSLTIESAPTVDEMLFQAIAPPIVFDGVDVTASAAPIQLKAVRTPTTVPLAPIVRWKMNLSAGATGTWGMTFRIRAIPGRSRFFAPTDIAGNVAWFRSDIGVGKDAVTNKVNTWADQSGLGHDLTSSGGNRPTWVASSINAHPSINFDPAVGAQFLATAAFALGTYTILMVTTGQELTNGYFFTRSSAGVNVDTLYGTVTNTTEVNRGTLSAYDDVPAWGQWGSSTAKLLVQLFDGTHAGHIVQLNTTPIATTPISAADPGTATTSDKLVLAARDDGFLASRIRVAEVILYDRVLATDELAIVQEYLRRRYGLY